MLRANDGHVTRATPETADSVFADGKLTIFARQALQCDWGLKSHNIGVMVQGRTATLWGAIGSPALSERAENLVRQVPGISKVHNHLRVEQMPLPTQTKELFHVWSPVKSAKPSPEHSRNLEPPGRLTGWGPPGGAPPVATVVMLGMPISPAPRPPVAAAVRSELEIALEKLQQKDPRYRRLRLDVQDATLRLAGTVDRWADVLEFADRAARIPGLKHVNIDRVTTTRIDALDLP
jgi:osmotically-inducible protein OsmY